MSTVHTIPCSSGELSKSMLLEYLEGDRDPVVLSLLYHELQFPSMDHSFINLSVSELEN